MSNEKQTASEECKEIKIPAVAIKSALKEHLLDIKRKIEDKNRFTKFDSVNDIFAGACGEYAFSIELIKNGYIMKDTEAEKNFGSYDYIRLEKEKNQLSESSSPEILKHFKNVQGKYFDKYDFLLKDFFVNKKGVPVRDLSIDVKTQYRTPYATVNDEWQFAINENTVKQIQTDKNKVDLFLFLFCKDQAKDFFEVKDHIKENNLKLMFAIEHLKANRIGKLKSEDINLLIGNFDEITNINSNTKLTIEVGGFISPKKFLDLGTKFEEGEIFRVNKYQNGFIFQKTEATMYRLFKKHLTPLKKQIPIRRLDQNKSKSINLNEMKEDRNSYLKAIKNKSPSYYEKMNFVKVQISNKDILIPYDKIYLNSQHLTFEDYLSSTFQRKKYTKRNDKKRKM